MPLISMRSKTCMKVVSIKQINAVSSSPALESLVNAIEEKKSILANKSRTAKLWINYIKYIQVCRNFIWASRTGDWHLHLHSASQMMNLFAATGHHNYAKSTRVHLQMMVDLSKSDPGIMKNSQMKVCLFVCRRSRPHWARL